MWHILTLLDNIITIRNTQTEDQVTATIYVSEDCKDVFKKVIDTFEVDYQEEVKLPQIDGLYKIKIDRLVNGVLIESEEYLYPYYGLLLSSIISEMDYFFCDCNCKDCDDCNNIDEKTHLSLILKMFSYYTLMYKYYPRFYDAVFRCLNCSILDIANCTLLTERVTGNTENNQLFKKIILSMYLSFYYAEYYNTEDKDYIDNKFKYNRIKKCMSINNVDIQCITSQIENNMGIFEINFGAYINLPPNQVGDFSTSSGNRTTVTLTPAMFTTLTVPVYADPEGDAAQAVRIDTLPTNGGILKVSGTPVTIGQVILMSTIASNALTLEGPDQDPIATCTFTFSVRDAGSMTFTS